MRSAGAEAGDPAGAGKLAEAVDPAGAGEPVVTESLPPAEQPVRVAEVTDA